MIKAKLKPIQKQHQQYQSIIQNKKEINPIPLSLQLLSNPFLKDQDSYKSMLKDLQLYNKRVLLKEIIDQYEIMSYDKMFVIIEELIQLSSVEDMMHRLEQTMTWWKEQKRMVKQRKDLGVVKYKTDRKIDKLRQFKQLQRLNKSLMLDTRPMLTHQKRFEVIYPYQMKYRSIHPEIDIPLKLLSQYKRKIIYINDQMGQQEVIKYKDKVIYSKPQPIAVPQQIIESNIENVAQQPQQNNINPESPQINQNKSQQNALVNNQDVVNPVDPIDENTNNQKQQPAQDLGGFGQEPEQPGQQQQAEQLPVLDKLAPKNKIYKQSIRSMQEQQKITKYKAPYMFHLGTDDHIQRRLQQRLVKQQQKSLQLKRQQQQFINRANQWAIQKSKLIKQSQHNLQNMIVRYKHSYSYQKPQPKKMLKPIDEKKYGFYIPTKPEPKPFINLLPQQKLYKSITLQQQIRKNQLKSLKSKFSKILNLNQSMQLRQNTDTSMCQVSPRRKDLSIILQEHSLQKERDLQLQQIQKIKNNLGKHRINLNIRNLAHALVSDCANQKRQKFQSPDKMLPNNPFFDQGKKKKKKK